MGLLRWLCEKHCWSALRDRSCRSFCQDQLQVVFCRSHLLTPAIRTGLIFLKLGHDLLKIHEALGSATPALYFCFDSLTAGHQTAGLWHCFKHPVLGAVLRNIHRLIETGFDPTVYHWHVKGRSGHPGNELVDLLAQQAHEREPDATTSWPATLGTQAFKTNSDWFWMHHDLCHPRDTTTSSPPSSC